MRRTLWVLLSFLISTAAYGQSAQPPALPAGAPEACNDVETYKDNAPAHYYDFDVWQNVEQCDAWAEKDGNLKLVHDSFSAMKSLYLQEWSALDEDLGYSEKVPAACRVFQDDQKAFSDAVLASDRDKLSKTESLEKATRAQENFRARFKWSFRERDEATTDSYACVRWAFSSNRTVIAYKIGRFINELNEDTGPLPIDIEEVAPICKNASSEADAILEFVGRHAGDTRIMPSDVEPYYERATPLMHCAERLAETSYSNVREHLLLAVGGINNLMVIADSNDETKLIRALQQSQSQSGPIVIKVQNSHAEQNSSQARCTGTVLNLGSSLSSINWSCYP